MANTGMKMDGIFLKKGYCGELGFLSGVKSAFAVLVNHAVSFLKLTYTYWNLISRGVLELKLCCISFLMDL